MDCKYSLRSLVLENKTRGMKFSYEFTLLKSDIFLVFEYLKIKSNENHQGNFVDTLLTDTEFIEIIKLLNKEEMVSNLKLNNYHKIFGASGPQNYFTSDFLPTKEGNQVVYGIKVYSKFNGTFLFIYTLDFNLQALILSKIDELALEFDKKLTLDKNIAIFFENSYFYLRFNFNKFIYMFERIDPYEYLINDFETFNKNNKM